LFLEILSNVGSRITFYCRFAVIPQMRRLVSEDLSDRIHAQNLENIRHAVVEENDVTEEMARAFAGFLPQKP